MKLNARQYKKHRAQLLVALDEAAWSGNLTGLEELLKHPEFERDLQGQYCAHALRGAARQGHPACLQRLLDEPVCSSPTATITKALNQALELVTCMMTRTAKPLHNERFSASASFRGQHECMKLLLAFSPDSALAKSEQDFTPLMIAAQASHKQCLNMLLPFSDPQQTHCWTDPNRTYAPARPLDALELAVRAGRIDNVRILAPLRAWGGTSDYGLFEFVAERNKLKLLSILLAERQAHLHTNPMADASSSSSPELLFSHSPEKPLWRGFRSATDRRHWDCAELFLFALPLDSAQSLVSDHEPERFLRWKAHQERMALADAVTSSAPSHGLSMTQATATLTASELLSAIRKPRRL